jgi:hypothetical protein
VAQEGCVLALGYLPVLLFYCSLPSLVIALCPHCLPWSSLKQGMFMAPPQGFCTCFFHLGNAVPLVSPKAYLFCLNITFSKNQSWPF